ncbi:MAG: FAD-binding oxidoreductase, partial [Steroidobacteraceae bacterium]
VPRSADDVVALVRWAAETNAPLVPRGSGSGMAGGAVGDGVIVDLSRLRDIGQVDAARRVVLVGPGAIRDAVSEAGGPFGLHMPVDPSSGAFCTVGGMASTNAAGARTLRYGSMRRWVTALDCVFDDGSRAVVRRGEPPPLHVPAVSRFVEQARESLPAWHASATAHTGVRKESSGYALGEFSRSGELVDLLLGSEGTLAVLVGVEIALAPLPGATSTLRAEFPSLESAVTGAAQARQAGASACELLDRTFLDVAAEGGKTTIGSGVEAVLLAEVQGVDSAETRAQARELEAVFVHAGATAVRVALDAAAERALWEFRHAASPTLARLDPALKSMQFIEDSAVPVDRLQDYVRGVRRSLASAGVRGVIFGHAGDAHVHVNPLIDVRIPDWRARATRL